MFFVVIVMLFTDFVLTSFRSVLQLFFAGTLCLLPCCQNNKWGNYSIFTSVLSGFILLCFDSLDRFDVWSSSDHTPCVWAPFACHEYFWLDCCELCRQRPHVVAQLQWNRGDIIQWHKATAAAAVAATSWQEVLVYEPIQRPRYLRWRPQAHVAAASWQTVCLSSTTAAH